MNDPLDRATSRPPASLGEGCVSRYDPDELSGENGADFTDAAELWRLLQAPLKTPATELESLKPQPQAGDKTR